MSAYNDYMVKVVSYFVNLSAMYCNLLSQGVEDCCIKNKLNILAMYIDTIPRCGNENCLTTEEITAITEHINTLAGNQNWGTLTNINPIVPPTSGGVVTTPPATTVVPQAWNTVIGTTPTVISFNQALGTSGSSWAMTYIATDSLGNNVFVKSITNRTASGFTVDAYEDNVHFEGTAVLKTS